MGLFYLFYCLRKSTDSPTQSSKRVEFKMATGCNFLSLTDGAKVYDEVSELQIEVGKRFIRNLNLLLGDKVLDMGCGTGHLTKYIADIVGPDGLAVGIDPDAERIKIAQEKTKDVSNLQFYLGSSAVGFPHDNEPYCDVHISTSAFHWVPYDVR